jgi:ATP-dependent Clp protease protease subunit
MRIYNLNRTPKAVIEASKAEAFQIQCNDSDGTKPAELLIMDEIGKDFFGDGIGASDVVGFLANNQSKPVNVKINSFGGSFYDGLVMYNAFLQHDADITATIQGIAFSAATLPAMGATRLVMSAQSDFGIHRAWTLAAGNQNELRATVEWLESVDQHLIDVYQAKSKQTQGQIDTWLDGTDDGTVFNASQAVEMGFADEVLERKVENTKANLATLANLHRQKIKSRIRLTQAH